METNTLRNDTMIYQGTLTNSEIVAESARTCWSVLTYAKRRSFATRNSPGKSESAFTEIREKSQSSRGTFPVAPVFRRSWNARAHFLHAYKSNDKILQIHKLLALSFEQKWSWNGTQIRRGGGRRIPMCGSPQRPQSTQGKHLKVLKFITIFGF